LTSPYLERQLSDGEIWTAHGGVNPWVERSLKLRT
jgi:hypothetical protein